MFIYIKYRTYSPSNNYIIYLLYILKILFLKRRQVFRFIFTICYTIQGLYIYKKKNFNFEKYAILWIESRGYKFQRISPPAKIISYEFGLVKKQKHFEQRIFGIRYDLTTLSLCNSIRVLNLPRNFNHFRCIKCRAGYLLRMCIIICVDQRKLQLQCSVCRILFENSPIVRTVYLCVKYFVLDYILNGIFRIGFQTFRDTNVSSLLRRSQINERRKKQRLTQGYFYDKYRSFRIPIINPSWIFFFFF